MKAPTKPHKRPVMSRVIRFRCSNSFDERLQQAAWAREMSVSEFVRVTMKSKIVK